MKVIAKDEKDKLEILKAYAKFQSQVGNPKKNQDNPFTHSKYADLQSVIDTVKKGMKGTGLSFMQDFCDESNGNKLGVKTILIHDKGIIEFHPLEVPIEKATAQGIGSANTYARRYALTTNLGIAVEDDDGNSASQKSQYSSRSNYSNNYSNSNYHKTYSKPSYQSKPKEALVDSSSITTLMGMFKDLAQLEGKNQGGMVNATLKMYNKPSIDKLTQRQANSLSTALSQKYSKLKAAQDKKEVEPSATH